jgi:shikimate dehydrogenase
MIKACVIGHPVAHSRSPLIHGYWLRQYDIDGAYERRDVEPGSLASFLESLANSPYTGCNVTLPHKEEAARLVQHVAPKAKRLGSLNTVYVRNGETHGTTTDGEGFFANLLAHVPSFEAKGKTALVLGAGGSARAVVGELLDRNFAAVIVANRTASRAAEFRDAFGDRIWPCSAGEAASMAKHANLLINTTSQGMNGIDDVDLPLENLPPGAVVADIVYIPLKTALIQRAQVLGFATVPGLGMLLHQAVPGFELWFGVRPQVTNELHDLVAADIQKTS